MINPATDNNALTKFQPMPKRFMVWDVLHREWVAPYGHEEKNAPYAYDMYELMCRLSLTKIGVKSGQYVICQSTNLFDVRGIEIFEGSIIRDEDEGYFSVIEYRDGEYYGVDPYTTEIIDSLSAMKLCSEVIGHILSNLELLEEK